MGGSFGPPVPTLYPYSHPCIHSVWDLAVWTCSTSEATSFKHVLLSAFASGWGTTGFCVIWGGIKKKKRQRNLPLLWLPKQEKIRIFQASQAAGERAQSWWERVLSSRCCRYARSCLLSPPAPPWQNQSPGETPVWEPHGCSAPSLPLPVPLAERPLSFIFHAQSSRTETLVKKFYRSSQRYILVSFFAEEGRGVTGRGEGFVGLFFFFFLFATLVVQGSVLCY